VVYVSVSIGDVVLLLLLLNEFCGTVGVDVEKEKDA
jgi:hypothetical protein